MERVDVEGQVATANTLSRMLMAVPMMTQIILYDVHAESTRFSLREPLIPRPESCIPLLKDELRKLQVNGGEELCIAFPDEGANKRFAPAFAGYELSTCHKIRCI